MRMGDNQYKTVSLFSNGCSARYTCLEFHRKNNNVLQYRVSKSRRTDAEFDDLCSFHDDPYPLGDSYRSYFYKNLVLSKNLWPSYCGIDSTIPFNGTYDGERCEGVVTDWDEESCTTKGKITLRSHGCAALLPLVEFQCLAYIRKDDMTTTQQLLITRSMDGQNEYNCWVITSYVSGGKWPWRAMYRMPTTQCSVLTDIEVQAHTLKPKAALYLEDRSRTKICKPADMSPVTVSANMLTTTTSRGYYVDNVGPEIPPDIHVEPPIDAPSEQAPSLAGSYENAGGSAACAVYIVLTGLTLAVTLNKR